MFNRRLNGPSTYSFIQSSSNANRMLKIQLDSEADANATTSTRNRLLAPTLTDLLDESKAVTSTQELDRIAAKYNMDRTVLDGLIQSVNSPTPDDTKIRKVVDEDGGERFLTTVSAFM